MYISVIIPFMPDVACVVETPRTVAELYESVAAALGLQEGNFELQQDGEPVKEEELWCVEGSLHAVPSPKCKAREALEASGIAVGPAAAQEAAKAGDVETLQLLVAAGVRCQVAALLAAVAGGSVGAVQVLLGPGGVDPTLLSASGTLPIHIAALCGCTGSLEALLRAGADPNTPDPRTGRSPLHNTAVHGYSAAASILLAFGADPAALDSSGLTSSAAALAHKNPEVAVLFSDSGCDGTAPSTVPPTP